MLNKKNPLYYLKSVCKTFAENKCQSFKMQCCALKLTFILNLLPDAVNIFFLCQKDRQLKFLFCLQSIRKENKVLSDHSYKNARRTKSKVYFITHTSCTQHKIVVADNFLRNKRNLIPVVLMFFLRKVWLAYMFIHVEGDMKMDRIFTMLKFYQHDVYVLTI